MSRNEQKQIELERLYEAERQTDRMIEDEIGNLRHALPNIAPDRFKALVRHCKALVRLLDEQASQSRDYADLMESG